GTPERLRRNWFSSALMLCALLALALMVYMLLMLHSDSTQISGLGAAKATQDAQIDGLAGAVNSARAQIKDLGATPVVPAPSEILETITVSGPAGAQGPAGGGANGAPGSPPAGWSWTDPSGVTYDCTLDGQSPAPHYTCTPATASSSPSATGA